SGPRNSWFSARNRSRRAASSVVRSTAAFMPGLPRITSIGGAAEPHRTLRRRVELPARLDQISRGACRHQRRTLDSRALGQRRIVIDRSLEGPVVVHEMTLSRPQRLGSQTCSAVILNAFEADLALFDERTDSNG